MTNQPLIILNDGRSMPQLGFGVWKISDETTETVVGEAFDVGYRSIDTAAIYENEGGVGRAVKRAIAEDGILRKDIFITSKLWNDRQGYDEALKAFDESLKRLGLDYLDLYLIHWPVPWRELYVDSWRALIRLRAEGRVRSIGVSNFMIPHLERIIGETAVVPAINQIELHPLFPQADMRAFHQAHGIATECWQPLGRGVVLALPTVRDIAAKHGRTAAQVVLRWHMELGLIAIPKSKTSARIHENFAVFDFRLDAEDMAKLAPLQRKDGRLGGDPLEFG